MLISSPAKAWEEISLEQDRRAVMTTFVYPMIAFCGLSVFIGRLIGVGWGGAALQLAMTNCCAVFVALFGGFFLIAYLTNQYGQPFPVKVVAKEETTITFDANHEMAGKELNFRIELVEVK